MPGGANTRYPWTRCQRPPAHVDAVTPDVALRSRLGMLVRRLPARQRAVVTLRVQGDLPFKEIARWRASADSAKVSFYACREPAARMVGWIMTWPPWTCRRLRSRLVDLAAGTLEASARPQVVAHLARCRDCAATATALREVPALLRDDGRHARRRLLARPARRDHAAGARPPTPAAHSPRGQAAPRMLPDAFRRPVLWVPALAAAAIAGIALVLRAPAPEPVEPHCR